MDWQSWSTSTYVLYSILNFLALKWSPPSKIQISLVCPIPRYVKTKCCDDPSHIANFGNEDYEDELMDFQDQHRKILVGWGSSQGLDYEIFDPTTVVNPTEPGLGNRLTTSGTSLWAGNDGVHLSPEGYRDVAMGLVDIGRGDGEQALSDVSSSAQPPRAVKGRGRTASSRYRNRNETGAQLPRRPCLNG